MLFDKERLVYVWTFSNVQRVLAKRYILDIEQFNNYADLPTVSFWTETWTIACI